MKIILLCAAWMIPCPQITAIVMVYLTIAMFNSRRHALSVA
jgi:hypothetical protein